VSIRFLLNHLKGRWLIDGNIEFLGRVDEQLNIIGSRVELEEVESRLLHHENVKENVVIVKENENENKYLCAYLVARSETSVSQLREFLLNQLPDFTKNLI
jgi:acyl-coenzyme A synthetase/AMP-(fatty) acid ligase